MKEISGKAWRGYSGLRAALCCLKEEGYAGFLEAVREGYREKLMEIGMSEETAKRCETEIAGDWIKGLEQVHKTLMEMLEDGEIRVLEGAGGGRTTP